MKKIIFAILLMLSLSIVPICVFAEEVSEGGMPTEEKGDEFDLSNEQEKISELGIPTVDSVRKLKEEADDLYYAKNYKEAATAYSKYAKQANWIANILSSTLEPYYGASYDKRKEWYPEDLDFYELSAAESASNNYKAERNRAMLHEGLCYYYEKDYETALPLLIKALDLIEIEDEVNWQLGYDAVTSIIGYGNSVEVAVVETEEPEMEAVVETEAPVVEAVAETENPEEEEAIVETEIDASDVMTYEEYENAETDTFVTIEAYVQGKQKFYPDNPDVGTSTATLYAQDKDGGYFLYNVPVSEADYARIKEGTKIRFAGYKSEWAGEIEIMPDSIEPIEVLRGKIYISSPVDVTDILGDEDALVEYMNQRVVFTGMTVEPISSDESEEAQAYMYGWDGSGTDGDDLYFNASVDGNTYLFVVESNLCDESSEVYQAVKNLKIGDKVDLEGFLYWYEGPQPHIINVILPEEDE